MAESRTFRVFVSSTFKDLEAERNHLREHVYPGLRELCAAHGARFQEIDLRWGVSREASLDQQAMNVCLEEIERCRAVTPRPNFLVLLGNRHGWLAPPPQVEAAELEAIRARVPEGADRELLDRWYRRDDNAVPPEYYLRAREGALADDAAWGPVEARLHAVLAEAAAGTRYGDDPRYRASATEQEIRHGALGVGALEGRAFCFVRELVGEHPDPARAGPGAPILDFADPDQAPLARLKGELRRELPYREYEARWDPRAERPTTDHLEALARDVREALTAAILEEIEHPAPAPERAEADPLLDADGRAHRAFAEERYRVFVGRGDELAAIASYLDGDDARPLVVAGSGGTGKSALLAEALRRALDERREALVVYRFVGATAVSSDGRALLRGICQELARRTGADETAVPTGLQELVADFRERLAAAGASRSVILFLDSLDQLSESEGARGLAWLPVVLPAGVRIVVSTRPGGTLAPLEQRGAPLVELGALGAADGRELLARWLAEARRTLPPSQEEAVLAAFAASEGNPLYLRLAFQEARRWRSGEPPEELAVGVEGIIERNTFERLAGEESHGQVLVSHALGLLAASRYGLAEDELLDLLSRSPAVYEWFARGAQHLPPDLLARARDYRGAEAEDALGGWLERIRTAEDPSELRAFLEAVLPRRDGPRLPVVLWSRLAFDLRPYLTERETEGATLIAFFHRELAGVAAAGYLGAQAPAYHGELADYFRPDHGDARPDWEGASLRGLSELPYHLVGAERWDDVEETLTDFGFLEAKAARVAVERRTDGEGNEVVTYTGVRRLQEDFDLALRALGGGEAADRPRLVVTAVDFGEGPVVRCPHCNTVHELREGWLGNEITCPSEACDGPLRVNPFTVGGRAPADEERAPAPAEPEEPVEPVELPAPAPDLPLAAGAARLIQEGAPGGQAGVNHWLLALLRRHGPMAEDLSPGLDAGSLAVEIAGRLRGGEAGEPFPQQELVGAAARHARDRGNDRVAERDLAAVILAAAGREVREG